MKTGAITQPARVRIGTIIGRLTRTQPDWRRTALAVVADETGDPYRVLIACLLSLRTQDTTTGPAAERLFALADTPTAMLTVPRPRIERAIYPVGFYRTKAGVIHEISRALLERFGYVRTRTPDETEMALRRTLPRPYWMGYNDLLVGFGQNLCTPLSPHCSICPVRALCRRVGVTTAR